MKTLKFAFATPNEIRAYLGSKNWVIARRTAKVVAMYGEDVVCLTPKKYLEMEKAIIAARPHCGQVLP